ncbi:MAG: tyrosine-type recombinase/integrase [Flavobacterium sp.]
MATIKIVLDQRRAKKDETFPIVLRIRHKDRYFDIKTNYCVCKNLFDEKKQLIVSNLDANFNIEEQKEKYSKRIREFLQENRNTSFDINILKKFVLQKPAELTTIDEFWKEVIQQLLDSKKTGTARSYITTLSVISKIIDCNCMFTQVSYKDLIIIETTLLKRGVSVNGIAVYMRTFRAICNRAILYNVASLEWYPFRRYKIKKEKTTPRTISINEMQNYFAHIINTEDRLYKSWCIGKLIFMLRGINLTDLLLLKKCNVHNDRIIYKRAKTGKMYSVKILPHVQELITEFIDNSEYLFGNLMSHYEKQTLADAKLYADFRKKLNKKLKKISKILEIETPITTYVFRYSYANIAKQLGYSKDLIAESLGHEYGNSVTGIYLEMFDNEIIDKMNQNIIKRII